MSGPAMIFAAGRGTRMRPLTDTRPKALVEVAGRALLDHALAQIGDAAPVVVNAHHHAAQVVAHLSDRPDVRVVIETTLLETGGGLRNALPHLGPGPVLTMNADAVWTGPPAADTLRAAWRPGMEGLVLLVPRDRVVGATPGRFAPAADGSVGMAADGADSGFVYTGAGLHRTDRLDGFPDATFSLRALWSDMMDRRGLHACIHPGHWADVGTPEGVGAAEDMLRAHA